MLTTHITNGIQKASSLGGIDMAIKLNITSNIMDAHKALI